MVGVGIEGTESSLARVSVVNYYGVVEVDEFVQQKERVVDYRTKWSGIRAQDMVRGKQIIARSPTTSLLILRHHHSATLRRSPEKGRESSRG